MTLLFLIICLVVLGIVAWLVSAATIIDPKYKSFIQFVLLVAGAFIVISFLLSFGESGHIRMR